MTRALSPKTAAKIRIRKGKLANGSVFRYVRKPLRASLDPLPAAPKAEAKAVAKKSGKPKARPRKASPARAAKRKSA